MKTLPLTTEQSPLMILDLIFRMKVRDIMTTELITATRRASMKHIQKLMKTHGITGIPIVEARRFHGIVTIDNLINALEEGRINDPVSAHMVRRVISLEEDMPLSFAISYFSKYPFRRFPVINRRNEITGMVTTRDINVSLLTELFKKLKKMEAQHEPEEQPGGFKSHRVFRLRQHDFENAGKASIRTKALLQQHKIPAPLIRRVSVACYELEINLVAHSEGGTLTIHLDDHAAILTARDTGPGIADVDLAMTEGFSTANDWIKSLGFGAGMGLPNIRRVADEFEIRSTPGEGTFVKAVIHLNKEPI